MSLRVEFLLEYRIRHDEHAKAFVAYVPMLRLFTQAKTKRALKKAVDDLVIGFVRACHQQGLLDKTMRERGLVKVEGKHLQELLKKSQRAGRVQYISVGGDGAELYEVPITLLAGKQAIAECCQ